MGVELAISTFIPLYSKPSSPKSKNMFLNSLPKQQHTSNILDKNQEDEL